MAKQPDKMTFLEHLDELRQRLVRSVVALIVGFLACWSWHEQIFHVMTTPLRQAFPGPDGIVGTADDIKFIFTGPSEALMLYMKMSFFVGIFLVSPFVLYQIWAFIEPGLYPHEKSWVFPFVALGTLFFVGGASFGHFFLFPVTFKFLGDFGGADLQFMPKIDEYYSFYSWFLLGLGAVFQLPVVILILARIGLVTPGMLMRGWKLAVVGSFVLSAIVTPTPDMVTQSALAIPMIGLYFLGVFVAWAFGKERQQAPAPTSGA